MSPMLKKPINFTTIWIVICAFIASCVIVWSINNYSEHQSALKFFAEKEVKGKITALKNEKRGSYFIEIDDLITKHQMHSLRIGWAVEEYNISVGDSVSKDANSKRMVFYKLKNGVFEKLCEDEKIE
jgi:hypothetical protein